MIAKALALLAALALAGCSPKYVVLSVDDLCQSWRHQTVSKADKLTQPTAAIADGNNRARPEWGCEPGKDQAKPDANPWAPTVAKS